VTGAVYLIGSEKIFNNSCNTSHLVVRLRLLVVRAALFGITDNLSIRVFQCMTTLESAALYTA